MNDPIGKEITLGIAVSSTGYIAVVPVDLDDGADTGERALEEAKEIANDGTLFPFAGIVTVLVPATPRTP